VTADPREIVRSKKTYAVVGATRNKKKYGYLIFRILADHGYTAYPVNPHYATIDKVPCYKSLKALPDVPEVVVLVVPPAVGEKVIGEAHSLGVGTIWMPPGAGSAAAIAACEEFRMAHVDDACVILAVKHWGSRVKSA
jgi:hypothetical protein